MHCKKGYPYCQGRLPRRTCESVLPEALTSPQLTTEWENSLTLIAKVAADPENFMRDIEEMTRELVISSLALSGDRQGLFRANREAVGKCPPLRRGRVGGQEKLFLF